jgi:hypothetical protein
MNKIILIMLVWTLSIFAVGDHMVKKLIVNGKTRAVTIDTNLKDGALFLQAPDLAQALGFTLKRQGNLAILCTEQACLPFTIGGKEVLEKDSGLFISAEAFFNNIGCSWEFDEKTSAITIDLPDELPTTNAPVDITVGSTAPGFRVIDAIGAEIRLTDFLGKKNVVLEFFRSGDW